MKLVDLVFSVFVLLMASMCVVNAHPVVSRELVTSQSPLPTQLQHLYKRKNIFKKIKDGFKKAFKKIKNGFKKAGHGIKKAAKKVKKVAKGVWGGFKKPFKEGAKYLKEAFKHPGQTFKQIGHLISKPVTAVKQFIGQFKGKGSTEEKIGRALGVGTILAGGVAAGPAAGAVAGSTAGTAVEGAVLGASAARVSNQLADQAPSKIPDEDFSKTNSSQSRKNMTRSLSNDPQPEKKKASFGEGIKDFFKSVVAAPVTAVKDLKDNIKKSNQTK